MYREEVQNISTQNIFCGVYMAFSFFLQLLLETLSLMKNATMYIRLLAAEMFFIDPTMNHADILSVSTLSASYIHHLEVLWYFLYINFGSQFYNSAFL